MVARNLGKNMLCQFHSSNHHHLGVLGFRILILMIYIGFSDDLHWILMIYIGFF